MDAPAAPAAPAATEAPEAPPAPRPALALLRAWGVPVVSVAVLVTLLTLAARTASGDGAHLAGAELRLAELLRDGDIGRAFRIFSTFIAPQPPAGYVPGIAVALVLGASAATPIVAMAIPLLLLWDAFRRLDDGRLPWAPWLVVVASPLTWLYVEQHGRDLVAAAVLAQTIAWLHAARGFTDRRASVAFGAWLALGFLTKYTFPMFAVLPCLVAGLSLRSTERWKALGLAVLAFAVVAGPWYGSYFGRVMDYVVPTDAAMAASQAANQREQGVLTPSVLALYPLAMKDALGWPGALVVLVGAAVGGRKSVLPLAAALGGIALLTPLGQAQDRYALPAFVALAALVAPLARSRLGAVAVLAVFGVQLAATVAIFRPGAPTTPTASFDHPPASAAVLSWPKSRSYTPVDVDLAAWKVDDAIAGLRAVHGGPTGTVGLLLPRNPMSPDFGVFLARSAALGNRWDFANVNLAAGRGGLADPYFLGPLRDVGWPSSRCTALYAILENRRDAATSAWLATHRLAVQARFALPGGATGVVYRVLH